MQVESTEDRQLKSKKLKASAFAAGLIAFSIMAVSNAWATVLTVNSISAEWTNPVDGANITNNGVQSNPTAAEIWWGNVPQGDPQSGFTFLTSAPGSFPVTVGDAFSLGTFTHHNNMIDNGPITQVRLDLNLDIGGSNVGPFLTVFDFFESPNSCSPQPDCSNDTISLPEIGTSTTISVGDQMYAFTILGFSIDGGLSFLNSLTTPEETLNSADLYAKVSAVPLPGAVWMFLTALSALGLSGWRRKKVA